VDTDTGQTEKPLLYLDVDGVLSLFGFASADDAPGPLTRIDGAVHCLLPDGGRHLAQLAEWFDLVWATGWEDLANEHLPALMDLPFTELPTLTFDGRAVFGSSHWKLDAITAHSGHRPAAWVDDNIDDACRLWALSREAPTLLVETLPSVGLTEGHVERLCDWACSEAIVPVQQHADRSSGRTRAA
jgi:hypothetical protein